MHEIHKNLEDSLRGDVLDSLLGIYTRSRFNRDLSRFAREAHKEQPLSLVLIDLDHFKSVNDTHGHTAGDQVLNQAATVIRLICEGKGHCYRWGGDEIVVLLPNHDLGEAEALAERIRSTIYEAKCGDYPDRFTVSCAVTSYPGISQAADNMFDDADGALSVAKNTGGNQVCSAGEVARTAGNQGSRIKRVPTGDVNRRLNSIKLWVSLQHGRAENFLIGVKNDSDEEVLIQEIRLESDGIPLTEPAKPPSPDLWKLRPKSSLPIGWRTATDPAMSLLRIKGDPGIFFNAEMQIVLECELFGMRKEFHQKLLVQVNVTNREILQLAP